MRKLVIDVQVTCPVPGDKSLTLNQAVIPGRAAKTAYDRKTHKYTDGGLGLQDAMQVSKGIFYYLLL